MKWCVLMLVVGLIAPVNGFAKTKASRSTTASNSISGSQPSLLDSSNSGSGDLAALPDIDHEQTAVAQPMHSTRRTQLDVALLLGASFDNFNGTMNNNAYGGFGGYGYNGSNAATSNTGIGFTGGLLANFQINEMFSAESGLYYSPRNFSFQTTNAGVLQNTSITAQMIEIPIIARVWFAQYFSVGAGPYVGFGVGNVNVNSPQQNNGFNTFQPQQPTGSISYQQAGMNSFDMGILASAQAKIPVASNFYMLVDGRFNFGISDLRSNQNNNQFNNGFNNGFNQYGTNSSNISSSTTAVNTRSFRIFAGAGIGF